jgi:hypothetical protein
MGSKDPRVDAYIAKSANFAKPILRHLRRIVHAGCPKVEETIKWQFPHFDYKGVMCGMAAFKEHCAFGFWKEALIFDHDQVAEKTGMGSFGCTCRQRNRPDLVVIGPQGSAQLSDFESCFHLRSGNRLIDQHVRLACFQCRHRQSVTKQNAI